MLRLLGRLRIQLGTLAVPALVVPVLFGIRWLWLLARWCTVEGRRPIAVWCAGGWKQRCGSNEGIVLFKGSGGQMCRHRMLEQGRMTRRELMMLMRVVRVKRGLLLLLTGWNLDEGTEWLEGMLMMMLETQAGRGQSRRKQLLLLLQLRTNIGGLLLHQGGDG